VQREDSSWLFDGLLPIEELKDTLHLRALPDEASGNYDTLAGFMLMELGRIPTAGDHFEWNGYRFEVIDMDGRRIDKVLVQPVVRPDTSHPTYEA
jgi:putative hemolysin